MSRGDKVEAELSPAEVVFHPGLCHCNTGPVSAASVTIVTAVNDRSTSGAGDYAGICDEAV